MENSIRVIEEELAKINMVLDKLQQKRNIDVSNKLTEKCNQVVDKVEYLYEQDKDKTYTFRLISCLKKLLNMCFILRAYNDYLQMTSDVKETNKISENNTKKLVFENKDAA